MSEQFPMNCPKCGAHDYGLFAAAMQGCPHCLRAERDALRESLNRAVSLPTASEAARNIVLEKKVDELRALLRDVRRRYVLFPDDAARIDAALEEPK